MVKILLSLLMVFIMHHPLKAQPGSGIIGISQIGNDRLAFPAIGRAATQNCVIPGPCGSTCAVFTFIGTGNWNIEENWEGNTIPPTILTGCSQILINPAGNSECILNISQQIIPPGTSLTVMAGKNFRMPGNLLIQ